MDGEPSARLTDRGTMTDGFDAFNDFERAMWEQRAAAYTDGFAALTPFSTDALLDAAGVHAGTAVLDIGTGPGFVAAAAADRGATVTGIDVADAMVEIAHARVPAGHFRRASAEALPLADDSFDAVVGNFVLLHLGHPDRGVAEARRVLRPNGRCAFTVWEPPAVNRIMGVFHEAVERAGVGAPAGVPVGPSMFGFGDHDAFTQLLDDAGFVSVAITQCRTSLRVEPAKWWESVLQSTPRTGSLISGQSPAVQAEIRRHYDALVAPYADGTDVVLPVVAVLASGVAPSS